MLSELKQNQLLNSQRRLYKKRAKDNRLVEIGYYRCAGVRETSSPDWELHSVKGLIPGFLTKFSKELYYPGWLGDDSGRGLSDDGNRKLVEIPIFNYFKEIYVTFDKVVGFTDPDSGYSWYYQDFVSTNKTYY